MESIACKLIQYKTNSATPGPLYECTGTGPGVLITEVTAL